MKRYGAEVKGERLSILFDGDDWYAGVVKSFDACNEKHHVLYDDGDQRWHALGEVEKASRAVVEHLVRTTETVVSEELLAWTSTGSKKDGEDDDEKKKDGDEEAKGK